MYKDVLNMYMKATGMEFNVQKPSISFNELQKGLERVLKTILPYTKNHFNRYLKYLGFNLKENEYGHQD